MPKSVCGNIAKVYRDHSLPFTMVKPIRFILIVLFDEARELPINFEQPLLRRQVYVL
jgi:hypothetical protein